MNGTYIASTYQFSNSQQMECCFHIWSSVYNYCLKLLDAIQKRAMKLFNSSAFTRTQKKTTTNKFQPMDKSFMGPLKTCCNKEVRVSLPENNIAALFGKVSRKCKTREMTAKGFSLLRIYHLIDTASRSLTMS